MPTLAAPVAQLAQQAAAAFYRHADSPDVLGPADEHGRLWLLGYEARCADQEGNPAFAATLLPGTTAAPLAGPGLPLVPAGVRYAVDEAGPGTATITVAVGGLVGMRVIPPGIGATPFNAAVAATATQATATIPAPADGVYQVQVLVGPVPLATLYLSINRAEWGRFREQVRALAFGFAPRRPPLAGPTRARLARLIAADAAAHAGDPALAGRLLASAAAVATAPSPVALYPRSHG